MDLSVRLWTGKSPNSYPTTSLPLCAEKKEFIENPNFVFFLHVSKEFIENTNFVFLLVTKY